MRTMYIILAVTGWAWLALVAAGLPVLLWHDRRRRAAQDARRGFEVVGVTERHGTQ